MKTLLFALWIISFVHANTYFRRIGWINPNPSYGHIHFSINLGKIITHLENMQLSLQHFDNKIQDIHHPLVKIRAHKFISGSLNEIVNTQRKFQDYLGLIHSTPHDTKRVKRFLGMIMALTSMTMSLFNSAEILHLQASLSSVTNRQNHIADILQEHEVAIHDVKHDLQIIKETFIKIANIVDENTAMVTIHDAELQISRAIDELHQMVECITAGTERLFMHRLPLCFINVTHLESAHQRLQNSATKMNVTPLPINTASYLQFETSFILEKHLLHIFVHVPLADYTQQMELLEFLHIPIALTPALHMTIKPLHEFLAVGPDGLHSTLSNQHLHQCRKYADVHFCDYPLVLEKEFSGTCLGAIYSQNYTNLEHKCPVVFIDANEFITPISGNEFLFYTHRPQTIQVSCKKGRTHIAVSTSQFIKLEQGCSVSTATHLFRTGFDLSITDDIQQWPMVWNISKTLFDVDETHLENMVQELKLFNSHPVPIRDIKNLIWKKNQSATNIWLTIMIAVTSVFVLSLMAFLGWRYFRLYREQHNTPA